MSSYYCEFCDVLLRKASYKQRRTHNRGKNHYLMRKTYYLEILEDKKIRNELNKKILIVGNRQLKFQLPPGFSQKKMLPAVPEIPQNIKSFVIPFGFNFEDKRNYPKNMFEIKKIIDGQYF